jgi:anti-anti-sigma factor
MRLFSGETKINEFSNYAIEKKIEYGAGFETDQHLEQFKVLRAVALTNDYIVQEHGDLCIYTTLFFGVLDPSSGMLVYINAGHEPVFVVGSDGIKKKLDASGLPVGLMAQSMKFIGNQVRIEEGDILFGYTDGLIDAYSENGELYTRKRLIAQLERPVSSVSELVDRVKSDMSIHIGETKPYDDITILALQHLKKEKLKIIEERTGDVRIIHLDGRLDYETSSQFEKKLFDATSSESDKIIIDFKDVDYISSAGIRVLMKITETVKKLDSLIFFCTMQEFVKEVFVISNLDSKLPILATIDEALKAF